ncbi:MAG: hypothetical protein ACK5O2_00655 [Microthrixaceae bacterium]
MPIRGQQSGYGLVEALVSIMLTSVVILGLAGSLLTAIKSSGVSERVQRADSAIGSFTESLRSMPYPSASGTCPDLNDYRSAWGNYPERWVPPADISIEIVGVEHWQPTGTDAGSFTATCPAEDPSTHRLTVEVGLDGRDRTAQVVLGR